jgi:hypothetical protein
VWSRLSLNRINSASFALGCFPRPNTNGWVVCKRYLELSRVHLPGSAVGPALRVRLSQID